MFCCIGPVVFAALPGFFFRLGYTPLAYSLQQLFLFNNIISFSFYLEDKREKCLSLPRLTAGEV